MRKQRKGQSASTFCTTIRQKLSSAVAIAAIKAGFDRCWNQRWQALPSCRQTKQWFPTLDRGKSKQIIMSDRKTLSTLVQLITGHNYLKRHDALVHHNDDNECRLCLEDEETSFHIVAECPALARQRLATLGNIVLSLPLVWNKGRVLSFLREASIGHLLCSEREE